MEKTIAELNEGCANKSLLFSMPLDTRITRVRRIHADKIPVRIRENPPHPRYPRIYCLLWMDVSFMHRLQLKAWASSPLVLPVENSITIASFNTDTDNHP